MDLSTDRETGWLPSGKKGMSEEEAKRAKSETNAGSTSERKDSGNQIPTVLVDVANVAYGPQSHGTRPKIRYVRLVLLELGSREAKTIAVADASLRHNIDDKAGFEELIARGQIQQVPAGTDADDLIWSFAKRYRDRGDGAYSYERQVSLRKSTI